jgi:hypothetical protein
MVSVRIFEIVKNKAVFAMSALLLLLGFGGIASAQCPICVIGAAAGIEVARFFGVDDLITGVWVGALIFAFTLWMDSIIKTRPKWKRWRVPIAIAIVVLSYVSLYLAGFYNGTMISGINRLLLGDILGSIVLVLSVFVVNEELKKRNVKFPFRGVILVLGALTILSILIWVLILR